ncbi:Sterol O-acyltransferase 2 (Sterol-ester synthase 2) [Rhodotorula kratochvilovae]
MDLTEPPPGPANLLDDALRHPDTPLNLDSPATDPLAAPPRTTHLDAALAPGSTPGSSRSMTPVDSAGPRSTTTITTVETNGGHSTTETRSFTHVGAEHVDAAFSSSTGQITLRPIPAKGGDPRRIRLVRSRRTQFTPRISHFDRHNTTSAQDPFRGFFSLFWIVIFVGGARTIYNRFNETGGVLGWQFAALISEDAWALALSDAVLVGSTLLCVPFAKLVVNGWIRYYWSGLILQHVAQTAFLGIAVRWTFHRNWPWVQSGFMVLHALSMLMKVHSYCALNGELSERARQLAKDEKALEVAVDELGGRDKLEKEAREAWEKACSEAALETDEPRAASTSALAPPTSTAQPTSSDEEAASSLRQRPSPARRRSQSPTSPRRPIPPPSRAAAPHSSVETLTWHPRERISHLAIAICEAREALSSGGAANVTFPANVTVLNFIDYLLVPTLVYELEYPRTASIRPVYVLEKTLATFGTFSVLLLIVEHFVYPVMPGPESSFFGSLLDLALPFTICYLLIFYIIFECICNAFAEITRFSDRAFYSDWWNSTSFDEFSRKWNRPVHTFLLRHVYATTIATYRLSKFSAAFVTFLLSALVHELVMVVVTHKLRMYLFVLQMAQLPLIMIGRAPIFKRHPALGNLFFWLGLLSGFPLLAVAYLKF